MASDAAFTTLWIIVIYVWNALSCMYAFWSIPLCHPGAVRIFKIPSYDRCYALLIDMVNYSVVLKIQEHCTQLSCSNIQVIPYRCANSIKTTLDATLENYICRVDWTDLKHKKDHLNGLIKTICIYLHPSHNSWFHGMFSGQSANSAAPM